ncbi:acyl-CoA dehydrogenase family protein [Thiomonas sp. FB-6]|uniref:acyl-CoA dehydrogenase family protein n=1 Tax=Thiomonas sp. FB-6 TaxID=1158291 RepID=UPI00037CBAB1|nr:acyl-CoA dehydrogenase family protein [Thiomonas sp. FB-6]
MELDILPELAGLRDELRRTLRELLPEELRRKVLLGRRLGREDYLGWQRLLYGQGLGAVHWPGEWGGRGWSAAQSAVFDEECARLGAPRQLPFGLKMLAPVLLRFGTPEQRARLLPPIVEGRSWWCQGYSEPGAGSDLASLKTRARPDGDGFVLQGQKTWTTLAQHADWMFCLARTDPEAKPQSGISFLLVNMRSPGVRVRPIRLLDGEHEVNEVWLDDVRVPRENLVGDLHQGWTVAKYLLGHERANIAGVGIIRRELDRLRELAGAQALLAPDIAELEIDLLALEATQARMLGGDGPPGAQASMLKVLGSRLQQRVSELLLRAAGARALPFEPEAFEPPPGFEPVAGEDFALLAAQYANWRKVSIYGGSNEIQCNILARALGLDGGRD